MEANRLLKPEFSMTNVALACARTAKRDRADSIRRPRLLYRGEGKANGGLGIAERWRQHWYACRTPWTGSWKRIRHAQLFIDASAMAIRRRSTLWRRCRGRSPLHFDFKPIRQCRRQRRIGRVQPDRAADSPAVNGVSSGKRVFLKNSHMRPVVSRSEVTLPLASKV